MFIIVYAINLLYTFVMYVMYSIQCIYICTIPTVCGCKV